jgi:mannosyl-3-phosphoglycerate phosphatase
LIIVFTDLDGTLLDENYSYEAAKPTLDFLVRSHIPIVFCSSKTKAEIEVYRSELGIPDPFISENGGAIFIPKNYFTFPYDYTKQEGGYTIIELGRDYSMLRSALNKIREKSSSKIIGFGDMHAQEIAKECGLHLRQAELAKRRDYDEAFRIVAGNESDILRLIREEGLHCTKGGRYFHLMGDNDKGMAVRILTKLFSKKYKFIRTMGLGDSINDVPLLEEVDVPVLVKRADGTHNGDIPVKNIIKVDDIGPWGWKEAIETIVMVELNRQLENGSFG